ncbi:MAG: Gfo/Idh/MocA family oxidoreductase [Acidimicrobiia bacterium]|nr:Gfo/Idh/MocA family oxidoreductase [Acidimicrobiia bacterium]
MAGDDIVRWGILSTAHIGMALVTPAIQAADNCAVVALASREKTRARAAADQLGIETAYGTYEQLIADPDIDAIYNPLPNHLHLPWTVAAAEAGKHVLCEKPIGLTSAEARTIAATAESTGVKIMEAFMYRFHPTWAAVRDIVASGRIGPIQVIQAWFSYFNDDPANIRNVAEWGGGALMDIGCYPINVSRMLFGAEPTVVGATMTHDPSSGVDIVTTALLQFPTGVAAFTCATQLESDQRVHIYGRDGRISVEIPFNVPSDRPTRIFVTQGGDPPVAPAVETLSFDPADQYSLQARAFAAAVLDDVPVPLPLADSIANMTVIEEIVASAASNAG